MKVKEKALKEVRLSLPSAQRRASGEMSVAIGCTFFKVTGG